MDQVIGTVLVTGAMGQLGRAIYRICPDSPQFRFVFTDLPQGDITCQARMQELMDAHRPDVIVNCAAYTAVDRAQTEPDIAMKVNAHGAALLSRMAREYGAQLIHISTDFVFDGTSRTPYKEYDKPNPQSVYGKTKLAGEEAIVASGADAAIIRTSWLYSESGTNFVKTMLSLARSREEVAVVSDQWGSPTYAIDLARAVIVLIERGIRGCQIYHFSNDGETTWAGFAEEIFRLEGLPVRVRHITTAELGSPAPRPAYSVLDTSKIRESGGIRNIPWKVSLASCLRQMAHGSPDDVVHGGL